MKDVGADLIRGLSANPMNYSTDRMGTRIMLKEIGNDTRKDASRDLDPGKTQIRLSLVHSE